MMLNKTIVLPALVSNLMRSMSSYRTARIRGVCPSMVLAFMLLPVKRKEQTSLFTALTCSYVTNNFHTKIKVYFLQINHMSLYFMPVSNA